jgi:hypothetical protein
MRVAKVFIWMFNAPQTRVISVFLPAWGAFCVLPALFLPWWGQLILGGLVVFALWLLSPSRLIPWLAKQKTVIWWAENKPLMDQLVVGGMTRREAFVLLRLHQNGESHDGAVNEEAWDTEMGIIRDAFANLDGKGDMHDGG